MLQYIGEKGLTSEDLCVGLAQVGHPDQRILACSLSTMVNEDLGAPLHSLVIPGTMHPIEKEFLSIFAHDDSHALFQN